MHLMQTECTVAQLGEVLNIKQPSLSQQLGVLRRSGLVTTRKKGKYVFYGNVRMEARKILEMVEDVFPVTQQKRRKQKI